MLTLVTTDMLTEGVDFRLDLITPHMLGWKSIAANISDIAAMAGVPTWTFVSLGLRPDTEVSFVDELYKGMNQCAGRFGSTIIGGDINSVAGDYILSVTQMGRVGPDHLTLRSGARLGDRILTTGCLGDSVGGLLLLLQYGYDRAIRLSGGLVKAHLMPIPRVREAGVAAETARIHAMMDLSDGLGADLPKLCRAGNVGATVYAEKLPVSRELRDASDLIDKNAVELAASGGEDFELLMVVDEGDVARVITAVELGTGTTLTEIGEITDGPVEIAYPDGTRKPLTGGWEHFGD
jgi:thiamine-monophosphate kinase